jgi:GNAT superfamily N-acetyltransferase
VPSERPPTVFRVAGDDDVDAVTETITSAFLADPVWAPTLALLRRAVGGSVEVDRAWWRLFVESSIGTGWVWVTNRCEAAAVWIPPGTPELGPAQVAAAEAMLADLPERDAAYFRAFNELFEQARPTQPHYYLSLLATHGDHRGHGVGMALLSRTLAEVDAIGLPCYLESTNPANLGRYHSVGFEDLAVLPLPGGGPVITSMWRAPAAPGR